MARVLFLTHVLPYPLDSGARVRAYHLLRRLSDRHQVTLVSFARPDDSQAAIVHLRQICEDVAVAPIPRSLRQNLGAIFRGLATGLPMVIARDESPQMAALLRRLTRQRPFAVVHADQTAMAGYGQLAAAAAARPPRTLLDQHNAVHILARRMALSERQPLRRWIMRREANAFRRYERDMCSAYDAILTVTAEDREHLLRLFPSFQQASLAAKFVVTPISVDPTRVAPVAHTPPDNGPLILHLGTMFWPPNVEGVLWFARSVLPLIHQAQPTARFAIIGKNPPPAVQALAADPRIEVTGYLADPSSYLRAAAAFVVPLLAGSGMRVKILDAWLWGLPVVTTTLGAEGLAVRPGHNLLLADDPDQFAAAVLDLLTDADLNRHLRQQGRAWVEAHYSVQALYTQVDALYDHLLSPSPASTLSLAPR